MAEVAVATVVTYNHLHTALCLVRSIRRRWTTQPTVFIALVDHVDRPRPGFEHVAGVEFVEPRHLDLPNLGWLLCKLTPTELCCTLKPFLVRTLFERGFDTVLYCDSDIHFFADGAPFVRDIGLADFHVTPHIMSPLPSDDPWTSTTMGQLGEAGVLNAGLFAVRNTAGTRSFLESWQRLCAGPGAFLRELGNQNEQQFFNWVLTFSDSVRLCRDPRVNVAYWNLHERAIRWGGLDERGRDLWYLGDQPIICFHFSGFAWDRGRLSVFDDRSRPRANANLFALCEYYATALAEAERGHYASIAYEFDTVAGVPLDAFVRTELKRAEARSTPPADDWPQSGHAALGRLNTTLGEASLVPRFLEPIQVRVDLQPFYDPLFPREWIRWADRGLWRDHPVQGRLYDACCPFVYHRAAFDDLLGELRRVHPTLDDATIAELLKRGRLRLLQEFDDTGLPHHARHAIEVASYRVPAFVPATAIRLLHAESPHLQEQFPDVTGADFPRFKEWLAEAGDVLDCPGPVRDFISGFDFERSMARVLGKSLRIPGLVDEIRRDDYGRDHLARLVGGAQAGCGYGADDLVIADWWLEGLGDVARRRVRSLLPPEAGQHGFAEYLGAWCRRHGIVDAVTSPDEVDRTVAALEQSIVDGTEPGEHLAAGRARAALVPQPRGVNVFGYFRSPIGLGTATTGLCRALECAGYEHRDLVIPNDSLDASFTLDDLFPDFAFNYRRNIVVSYPHIEYQLQSVRPRCFFEGRETIGYFAWEQRDFPSAWSDRLAPYDKLCALSRFAAEGIARGVGRPVAVLPCVVETGAPVPKAAARAQFGIAADAFVVGYVFDAASSIERKNPLAVVDAVEKAFGRSRDVLLILKVGSGRRLEFASQMAEIERRVAALPGSTVIKDDLPRRDLEVLMCAMDVYLSLHRSEGFGYTLAEAMLLGIPAVATGYSGNLDFMTDRNSHLVAAREVVITKREGPFENGTVWAEPDIDHAVEILRRIRHDYSAACRRAADAVADLGSIVSAGAVAQSVAAIIEGTASGAARTEPASPSSAARQLPPLEISTRCPSAPPVSLLGISIPRSGHHFLASLLEHALGSDVRYCEYYSQEDCCKRVPCIRPSDRLLTYQKNHDLDLTVDPKLSGVSYVVQYRRPVPAAVSDRELFAEVRGRTLADDRGQYLVFLAEKGAHYVKFYDKWVRDAGPRSLVVKYEDLLGDPGAIVTRLLRFVGLEVEPDRIARAVAAVVPVVNRPPIVSPAPELRFQPRVAASSRYFDAEILPAYESIVLDRVPELCGERTFAATDYRDHPLFALFTVKCATLEGRHEDAAREALEALSRWPGHPHVNFVAGECLRRIGRYGEALPRLELACGLAAHDGEVLISCANTHIALGDFARAADLAAQVVALLPDYATHRLFLATVLQMAGRPREATEQALQALEYGIAEPHLWQVFHQVVRDAQRSGWTVRVGPSSQTP